MIGKTNTHKNHIIHMRSGKNATVVDKIQQFPITINYRKDYY
jgi:hypothetical protein